VEKLFSWIAGKRGERRHARMKKQGPDPAKVSGQKTGHRAHVGVLGFQGKHKGKNNG